MSSFEKQIGGDHYSKMPIQPAHYSHVNCLGFIAGSVIKYVSRYKSKNGRQDLEKAIHFIEMLIEAEYPDSVASFCDPHKTTDIAVQNAKKDYERRLNGRASR